MPSRTFNCPNCGAELASKFEMTKLVTCEFCDSSVFLDDEAVKLAGERGVMSKRPSLLKLGETYRYRTWQFTIIGHAQFDYEHGFWDEFWAQIDGEGRWISVDEGDIAIEVPIDISEAPPFESLEPGHQARVLGQEFVVTEVGSGTCTAFQGELPELLTIGHSFKFAHLRSGGARLVTLEYDLWDIRATDGLWIDPFEVKPAR